MLRIIKEATYAVIKKKENLLVIEETNKVIKDTKKILVDVRIEVQSEKNILKSLINNIKVTEKKFREKDLELTKKEKETKKELNKLELTIQEKQKQLNNLQISIQEKEEILLNKEKEKAEKTLRSLYENKNLDQLIENFLSSSYDSFVLTLPTMVDFTMAFINGKNESFNKERYSPLYYIDAMKLYSPYIRGFFNILNKNGFYVNNDDLKRKYLVLIKEKVTVAGRSNCIK